MALLVPPPTRPAEAAAAGVARPPKPALLLAPEAFGRSMLVSAAAAAAVPLGVGCLLAASATAPLLLEAPACCWLRGCCCPRPPATACSSGSPLLPCCSLAALLRCAAKAPSPPAPLPVAAAPHCSAWPPRMPPAGLSSLPCGLYPIPLRERWGADCIERWLGLRLPVPLRQALGERLAPASLWPSAGPSEESTGGTGGGRLRRWRRGSGLAVAAAEHTLPGWLPVGPGG